MNEEYGVKITAEISQFKQSLKELSQLVKTFQQEVEKSITIPGIKFGNDNFLKKFFNAREGKNIVKEVSDTDIYNETKRYTELTRMIEKAQSNVSKYDDKINQLQQDMEEVATASEKAFEQSEKLAELDFKADQGESFTPAEALIYSQLNRSQIEKDTQKYYDTNIKNEQKMSELVQHRIIEQQQLDALIAKRNAEAQNGTTQEQLKEEKNEVNELKKEYDKLKSSSFNTSFNLGKMFDKSIAKIKRFTFYLLGARSVFSLFMKYQSVYFQYNEQMQYQSELSQNAIALSLAPAFELLGNVMTYASIAFAKFIELLTGVNVLSKVSTKGIRDYNKSLKETQTLISGIDEITNLTNPQNLGLASQYKALDEFQKKVAEVNKWFEDNPWVGDLAKGLSDIVSYISEHWDIFKYIIGGAVLTSFLGFSLKGPGVGVLTLTATLTLIGIAEAISEIERLKREAHDLSKSVLDKWPDVFQTVIDRLKKTKKGSKEWDEQVALIKESMKGVSSEIINGKLEYDEYKPVIDEIIKKLKALGDDTFTPEIDFLMKLTGDEKDLALLRGYFETGSVEVNADDYPVEKKKTTAEELNEKLYSTQEGDSVPKQLMKGAAGIMDTVSTKISNWLGKKLGIPGFASGLDYVPYDNFSAILHKGETVVPAKYNPTIHSVGNEETNSLLETLIVKVDSLANRPNEFNVDGEKLARTMYPLLQTEERNYMYNEGVIR